MKSIYLIVLFFAFNIVLGQENKTKIKQNKEVAGLINKGIDAYNTAEYETAEKYFRKALSKEPLNAVSSYNLGLTLTETERNMEAERFFEKAGKNSMNKSVKDKAYFNAGNVWLAKKKYEKAIELYKNALRNDPTDEEARYNLALAKKLLKKQNKNKKNNKNKNKDKNKDKQKKDKKKNKQDKQNKNNKDKNKKDKKNDKKKGDKNKDKNQQNKDKKDKQGKGNKQKQQQNKQGQKPKSKLTPQQVKQLLVGLKNKEKKTQKKIAVKKLKGKGKKKKSDKDW